MSDDVTKGLKDLFAGVSSPWDIAALAAGAGAGAVVTILIGGSDLGSAIAAGATLSLTAKKGAEASLAGKQLRKHLTMKSTSLLDLLRNRQPEGSVEVGLLLELEREIELWRNQLTSDSAFGKELDRIVESYRNSKSQSRVDPPDNILKMPRG